MKPFRRQVINKKFERRSSIPTAFSSGLQFYTNVFYLIFIRFRFFQLCLDFCQWFGLSYSPYGDIWHRLRTKIFLPENTTLSVDINNIFHFCRLRTSGLKVWLKFDDESKRNSNERLLCWNDFQVGTSHMDQCI